MNDIPNSENAQISADPIEDRLLEYLEMGGLRCPFCSSDNITAGSMECGTEPSQDVECEDCGETWADIYILDGIAYVDRNIEVRSGDVYTNQMWMLCFEITSGEYQHRDELRFFGTQEEAELYAEQYLDDYWGLDGDTVYDRDLDAYFTKTGDRSVVFMGAYPKEDVVIMTATGAKKFKLIYKPLT